MLFQEKQLCITNSLSLLYALIPIIALTVPKDVEEYIESHMQCYFCASLGTMCCCIQRSCHLTVEIINMSKAM